MAKSKTRIKRRKKQSKKANHDYASSNRWTPMTDLMAKLSHASEEVASQTPVPIPEQAKKEMVAEKKSHNTQIGS
jgi:hypothetical protein